MTSILNLLFLTAKGEVWRRNLFPVASDETFNDNHMMGQNKSVSIMICESIFNYLDSQSWSYLLSTGPTQNNSSDLTNSVNIDNIDI